MINRRDFAKYISFLPFLGALLPQKLLASAPAITPKLPDFVLENELQDILNRTNEEINNCQAFKIFNIINLEVGQYQEFDLEDNVGYIIRKHGHLPERFIGSSLYSDSYTIGTSIDWSITDRKYYDRAIELFIIGFVKKINFDAFTLLKYSGMDNPEPNWDKITDIYGTENALLRVNKFQSDNCNIHLVDNNNGLHDDEILGLDLKQHDKLFITLKEGLCIFTDNLLTRLRREGFYGIMDIGYVNTSKDIAYYIKVD